jgi:surface protein
MKRILILSAILIFACSTDSEGNPCIYEPTLTTQAATDITETSATLNGVISIVSENCDVPNNTEQGFVYSSEIQPTLEDIQVNVNGTNISTTIEGLEPNTTYYVRAFLTNNLGDFYGDEVSFSTNEVPCDVVYLAENGITIKACEDAVVSEVGVVNGVEYTVVDRAMLDEMIANDEDLTVVCTTRVTDMHFMFFDNEVFNQPIDNWDVSNVTDMSNMFETAIFNQPIGNWDVSSVTNMSGMFSENISFNQDLSNWSVGNVTECYGFSYNTPQWTLPQPNFTNCNP